MRKQTAFMAVLSAAVCMTAAAPMTNTGEALLTSYAAEKGWAEEDGSFVFYDADGYKETNTWKKRDGSWYYLDEDGIPAVNQRIDDFFVNEDGIMVKNQWIAADSDEEYDSPDSPVGGSWSYFGKDGKAVSSKWMTIDKKTYYFDEEGIMQTGILELDGAIYYLGDENDGGRKTGWILLEEMTNDTDDEEIWCYFDDSGKLVIHQMDRKIGGDYYTFLDGMMQTGWINVREAGFLPSKEQEASASEASAAQKSALSDFRYYDPENGGRRASGWFTIEGAPGISEEGDTYTFYFRSGQALAAENGLELFSINSEKYCFNENGERQTGIQTLTNENGESFRYYFDENGIMKTGKQTIYDEETEENQTWFFQTKGNSKGQGYHGVRDNQVYVNGLLQKADPELRYEAIDLGDGKRYLVNTSGTIQKASASSSSVSRPELGKGFKDIKDSNDTIWTVDSSGIIQ